MRKLERELIFRRNKLKLKLLKIPRQIFETIQKIESNFTDPSPSSKIQTLAIYISRGLKKLGGRVQRVINTRFKEMSKINLRNEFAIELLARFLSLIFYPGGERGNYFVERSV